MKNDIWYKENAAIITPFIDHSVKKNESGNKVASYGLSPSGYDIRLKEVKVFKINRHYDPMFDYMEGVDPKKPMDMETLHVFETPKGERYVKVRPGEIAIGVSHERFKMPRNVSGFLLVKSTYGRCGVSVINPLIDAGFEGELTVSFLNHNRGSDCRIYLDEGFAQFVCFETGTCETDYAEKGGNFQNSVGVTQGLQND